MNDTENKEIIHILLDNIKKAKTEDEMQRLRILLTNIPESNYNLEIIGQNSKLYQILLYRLLNSDGSKLVIVLNLLLQYMYPYLPDVNMKFSKLYIMKREENYQSSYDTYDPRYSIRTGFEIVTENELNLNLFINKTHLTCCSCCFPCCCPHPEKDIGYCNHETWTKITYKSIDGMCLKTALFVIQQYFNNYYNVTEWHGMLIFVTNISEYQQQQLQIVQQQGQASEVDAPPKYGEQ